MSMSLMCLHVRFALTNKEKKITSTATIYISCKIA